MNSLSNLINNKRFKELDEADRNIRTQILLNDARHIQQFEQPIKFQNKFQRMTAYEFQKGLELVKKELEAIVSAYNSNSLGNRDDTGKLFSYWNTLMAYLKTMLLEGGVSNKDITKINNLLDAIQPLVRDVASIAVEKDFTDIDQVDELLEKFDGNNWTPISRLQKKKNPDEIEAPILEADEEQADEEQADEQPDEEQPDEEQPAEEPAEEQPAEEQADEEIKVLEPVDVDTKKMKKYETILKNINSYGIEKLREYYKTITKKKSESDDKFYVKNRLKEALLKKLAQKAPKVQKPIDVQMPELEQVDNEPDAIADAFGMGKKYMKTKPSSLRYNNDLDDYYVYQSMK